MAKVRCPYCNAQGFKYLALEEVGGYAIVHCSECGAIHGGKE